MADVTGGLDEQRIEQFRQALIDAALDGYERAEISGLCREGAWEAAISAMRVLDLREVMARLERQAARRVGDS